MNIKMILCNRSFLMFTIDIYAHLTYFEFDNNFRKSKNITLIQYIYIINCSQCLKIKFTSILMCQTFQCLVPLTSNNYHHDLKISPLQHLFIDSYLYPTFYSLCFLSSLAVLLTDCLVSFSTASLTQQSIESQLRKFEVLIFRQPKSQNFSKNGFRLFPVYGKEQNPAASYDLQ